MENDAPIPEHQRRLNNVRLTNPKVARRSKITVPEHCHPLAKIVFNLMRQQAVTYAELEAVSGVLICTTKAYRGDNTPGLISLSANLNALGWEIVAVPRIDTLSAEVREALDVVAQSFHSDEQALGAAILAASEWPEWRDRRRLTTLKRSPKAIDA